MAQSAGRGEVTDRAIFVCLPNRSSPGNQFDYKGITLGVELVHVFLEDLFLDCRGRIGLFECDDEPFNEGVVNDIGASVATIIRASALGVGRRDDRESRCRGHNLTGFLDQDRFALQDTLEAHDLIGPTIQLVNEQYRTVFHCLEDRSFLKDRLAFDQAKATNQIILIRLG